MVKLMVVHPLSTMPRPKSDYTVQITLLVTKELRDRADRLSQTMPPRGMRMTRTDVLRAALAEGLGVLERRVRARKTR
jgi:hypothetical protein